jgi:hypothetical protein
MRKVKIASITIVLLTVLASLCLWVYIPWNLTWGATEEEVTRGMVGDDIVKSPSFIATRAVEVYASPEDIWPWIIQMGYGRAGFYSYDFLDNDGNPSADRILPEYQDLTVGDLVPLAERGSVIVVKLEYAKHLLLASKSGRFTWAWELFEVGQNQSRLVTRIRHDMDSAVMSFMWDTFEFVMMHKCLLGIKSRAESLKGTSASGFDLKVEVGK